MSEPMAQRQCACTYYGLQPQCQVCLPGTPMFWTSNETLLVDGAMQCPCCGRKM
mgnify:CR=1 FL=1